MGTLRSIDAPWDHDETKYYLVKREKWLTLDWNETWLVIDPKPYDKIIQGPFSVTTEEQKRLEQSGLTEWIVTHCGQVCRPPSQGSYTSI